MEQEGTSLSKIKTIKVFSPFVCVCVCAPDVTEVPGDIKSGKHWPQGLHSLGHNTGQLAIIH